VDGGAKKQCSSHCFWISPIPLLAVGGDNGLVVGPEPGEDPVASLAMMNSVRTLPCVYSPSGIYCPPMPSNYSNCYSIVN
jgi:hypothetical protein